MDENEVFEYLDKLRDSGTTNMFGAAPFIQSGFACNRQEAKDILLKWMHTFTERHPEG